MYQPAAFQEDRVAVMHELIRAYPLATLVTLTADGLEANHIPMLIDPEPAPFGTLRGHVARANPVWKTKPDCDVLVVFQGPQHYVSPSWYPSKKENGKVVPTWNYAVVHAGGPLVVHEDAEWLRGLVTQLTDTHEQHLPQPWRVTDAPEDYLRQMLRAIVGIEIPLRSLKGKWKLSQNRLPKDRAGVFEVLSTKSDETSVSALKLMIDTGKFDK